MSMIDKEQLLEQVAKYAPDSYGIVANVVNRMSAIEPKHGTWGENIYGYRKCSVCGRVTQVDECMREPLYLYCPYCGADMRGGENGR